MLYILDANVLITPFHRDVSSITLGLRVLYPDRERRRGSTVDAVIVHERSCLRPLPFNRFAWLVVMREQAI